MMTNFYLKINFYNNKYNNNKYNNNNNFNKFNYSNKNKINKFNTLFKVYFLILFSNLLLSTFLILYT